MFVVCKLEQFNLEPSPNQLLRIPLEIEVETKMVGFLPVYDTREDAIADYPNSELMEIRFKVIGSKEE